MKDSSSLFCCYEVNEVIFENPSTALNKVRVKSKMRKKCGRGEKGRECVRRELAPNRLVIRVAKFAIFNGTPRVASHKDFLTERERARERKARRSTYLGRFLAR